MLAKQLHRLPQHTIFGLNSSTQSGQGRRHGRQFGYGVKEAALTGTCGMLSLYSLLSLMCVSSAAVLGIVLALARVRDVFFGLLHFAFCFLLSRKCYFPTAIYRETKTEKNIIRGALGSSVWIWCGYLANPKSEHAYLSFDSVFRFFAYIQNAPFVRTLMASQQQQQRQQQYSLGYRQIAVYTQHMRTGYCRYCRYCRC